MKKFSVLHLSDLHIVKKRKKGYSKILNSLIKDIKEQTKHIDDLILIVTGDVIDKAKFGDTTEVAVEFFSDLFESLEGKIKYVFFTPGNHDKRRLDCRDVLQSHLCNKGYNDFDAEFKTGEWDNLYSHCFDEYRHLLNAISAKIGMEINTDLFYCDVIELNDCVIRINSLNSSVFSFNDNDCGMLHIGKFQIEKIEQDYESKNIDKRNVDVSITIMHHPTFWLHKSEYDQVVYKISSLDSLSTDVLLRGHTHDRSLENHYTLYNSFSTLVTGIGNNSSEDETSSKQAEHLQRYSIYTFMCDLNLIEITMRLSSQNSFISDYSAYINEVNESRKKIHFPLHIHDILANSFLRIPLANSDYQPIFPSKQILDEIEKNTEKLLEIKANLMRILSTYKRQLLESLNEDAMMKYGEDFVGLLEAQVTSQGADCIEEKRGALKNFLNANYKNVRENVQGLLFDACHIIAKSFFKDTITDDEAIRVQFRVYDKDKKAHVGLTNYTLCGVQGIQNGEITPVKWGEGLIQPSYERKKPLFFSLNKEFISEKRIEKTKWTDYFTYSPSIHCNQYSIRNHDVPSITFGISSNCNNCRLFFEILSLIPMQTVIDDFLMDICDSYMFSFADLI